jgi:hypothetical protein
MPDEPKDDTGEMKTLSDLESPRLEELRNKEEEIDTISVDELAAELTKWGEDKFKARYDSPFLVVVYTPPGDSELVDPQTVETDVSEVNTSPQRTTGMRCVLIRKSDRNAFKSKVTVGRAKNNDIVLRAAKVSKLHAAFLQDNRGYQIMDMGSANGTVVTGVRLKKNQVVRLKTGDMISFWRYVFEFFKPEGFISMLRKIS